MRVLSATLLALACLAPAEAFAANSYDVFRLGMSIPAFEKAVAENGGEAFDPIERSAKERNETPEDLGPYRVFLGGVPAEDEAMGTFLFKEGILKLATLEYEFLPHTVPGSWKSASECEAMFARIGTQIEAVYGPSTGLTDTDEDENRSVTRAWHRPDTTVELYMYLDAATGQRFQGSAEEGGTAYCGSLRATAFDGSEQERDSFSAEMEAFGAEQRDRR